MASAHSISTSESDSDRESDDNLRIAEDHTSIADTEDAFGGLRLNIGPHLYEPEADEDESRRGPRPESDDPSRLDPQRINEWCTCNHCQILQTDPEFVCCSEIEKVAAIISEAGELDDHIYKCITDCPGFKTVCLDRNVLRVAWLGFRQQYGSKAFEGPQAAKYRHTAYRQLQRWCWGYYGKYFRVILPSCAVSCIRAHYPEPGDEDTAVYTGFRLPVLE